MVRNQLPEHVIEEWKYYQKGKYFNFIYDTVQLLFNVPLNTVKIFGHAINLRGFFIQYIFSHCTI